MRPVRSTEPGAGTTVNVLISSGPAVISIFDLTNGSLIISTSIDVDPNVSTPTWTILNGGLLQFPDGHTVQGP